MKWAISNDSAQGRSNVPCNCNTDALTPVTLQTPACIRAMQPKLQSTQPASHPCMAPRASNPACDPSTQATQHLRSSPKKEADGLIHRPRVPWHRNKLESLLRCSVVSSIVKHQPSAIDPVIANGWLYAAPTQEEGQSIIPANFRPTIEPFGCSRCVSKTLANRTGATTPIGSHGDHRIIPRAPALPAAGTRNYGIASASVNSILPIAQQRLANRI
jgi:hypothetical protein